MKKTIFLTLFLTLFCCFLSAQNCYHKFHGEGLEFMRKQDYATAINRFWAAMISCTDGPSNNSLSDEIKDAQTRWVRDLENAISREKKATQEAVIAKEQAEKARAAEEAVRKDLEVKERLATERGQRATTLRLALLSDLVREKGRKTDALLLSWLAMQLSVADIAPLASGAFNKAVRDSFTTSIFDSKTAITQMEYFDRGQHLLVRAADGSIHILMPGNTNPVPIPDQEAIGVTAAAKAPWILTWRADNLVRLWHADGTLSATLEGHTEPIRHAAFSADGSKIMTASRDNTAKIWDVQGKLLATLTGHTGNVYDAQSAPDNQYILTRASDGTARIWDITGHALGVITVENSFLYDARWLPSGREVAALFADGSASIWSLDGKLQQVLGHSDVKNLVVASAKNELLVQSNDQKIRRFDAKGNLLGTIEHPGILLGAATDDAGNLTFSRAADGVLRIWEPNGRLVQELHGHRDAVLAVTHTAARGYTLTTSKDGTAKLWDQKGNVIVEWSLGSDAAPMARFSPDGQFVLLVNNGGKSVSRTPFPEDIYKGMSLTNVSLDAVIKTYNVELFEALVKKGK